MLFANLDQCLATLFIVFVGVVQWVFWFGMSGNFPVRKSNLWGDVKLRMEGYASLKPPSECKKCSTSTGVRPSGCALLSPLEHEVLLGTLKKVEQKNGILLTILIFSLTLLLGPLLESYPNDKTNVLPVVNDGANYILIVFVASFVAPLFVAFAGIVQLDQWNFRLLSVKYCKQTSAENLQDALISDLMRKERAFCFSANCTKYSVIIFLVLVIVDAVFQF
jgi:hypothetical protein